MEQEIKEILNEKLIGNDLYISDIILSYLKEKCFICWNNFMKEELSKSYCDTSPHLQLYMEICQNCIYKFKFRRCFLCKVYIDGHKSYIVGTLDSVCCKYCCEYKY